MPEAFCPILQLDSIVFEPFMDTHDLRLEVPYGDDYLVSSACLRPMASTTDATSAFIRWPQRMAALRKRTCPLADR
jgi:hypothetical protein